MGPTITVNVKWVILLGAILLAGSNYLTWLNKENLSRKEKNILHSRFDSLDRVVRDQEKIHVQTVKALQLDLKQDSILLSQLKQARKQDSALMIKQTLQLVRFNKQSSHRLVLTLDSAYNAEIQNTSR